MSHGPRGVGVDLLELAAAALGEEPEPEAPGAVRRSRAAPAPEQGRCAGRERGRGDVDATAIVLERLSGLRPQQQLELLLADATAPVEVDAVHLVLGRSVADCRDVRHPTPAEVASTVISSAKRTGSYSGKRATAIMIGNVVVRAAIAVASTIGVGR